MMYNIKNKFHILAAGAVMRKRIFEIIEVSKEHDKVGLKIFSAGVNFDAPDLYI